MDDTRNLGNIDTSSSNIGGDENAARFGVTQGFQGLETLFLEKMERATGLGK